MKVHTRLKAIRAHYLGLFKGDRKGVRECSMIGHWLHPWRMGRMRNGRPVTGEREPDPRTGKDYRFDEPLQPAKAIRAWCLDCREGPGEVRRCPHLNCPLWPYRLGRKLTPAELQPYLDEPDPNIAGGG